MYSLSYLTNIRLFLSDCVGSGAAPELQYLRPRAGPREAPSHRHCWCLLCIFVCPRPSSQCSEISKLCIPRSRVDCNYEWIRRLCIRRSRSASDSPSTETGEILTVVVEEYGTATVSWSYQNSQLRVFIFTVLSFRCEMFVPGPEPVPLLLIPFPVPLRSHSIMIKVQTWHFIVL